MTGTSDEPRITPTQDALDDDPRLAFVYQEALRGLLQQHDAFDSIHGKAATLIFATAFSSSLLGGRALSDGLDGAWEWLAVASLVVIGALAVVILWPYFNLWWRFTPDEMLSSYVDRIPPATMSEMHRELALRIESDRSRNGRLLRRLREALQLALVLLLLQLIAWLLAIANASGE